jgi:hypothetical protein
MIKPRIKEKKWGKKSTIADWENIAFTFYKTYEYIENVLHSLFKNNNPHCTLNTAKPSANDYRSSLRNCRHS